jgi:hypothetical protein
MILKIQNLDSQAKRETLTVSETLGEDCLSPDDSRDEKVRENLRRVAAMPLAHCLEEDHEMSPDYMARGLYTIQETDESRLPSGRTGYPAGGYHDQTQNLSTFEPATSSYVGLTSESGTLKKEI